MSELEKKNTVGSDSLEKSTSSDISLVGQEKSTGVLKAEILAQQWNTWYYKTILLISAFLVGYAYGLDGQTRYVYNATATNSYSHHSLLTTIGVVSGVAQAVCQIVYARLSDVFGRLELFLVSVVLYVVGTIIESQAYDVQRYAGGSVLYSVGYSGVIINLLFILSDFSPLKWRLFYSFVPAFPFIINTWISGKVTAAINTNWSWGVGMWAFIFPLACIPLVGCMIHMRILAGRTEEWREFKTKKTKYQELGLVKFLVYLFWTLDVIGLILFAAMLGCILVPLTLAGGVKSNWQNGSIIAPIVVGFVLIPVFAIWESKTEHAIAPFHLLKDRGVWAGLYISFSITLISAIEGSYLFTVLRVAVDLSIDDATIISSVASFVGTAAGFFFGLFVVYAKRLKGFIIAGTCIWLISLGILLHFRSGTDARSGIIAGLCLLGLGTTFFTYPVNVSMQSSVNHEHMAVVTALGYSFYRVGSAVGSAISGAIWTNTLYSKILKYMQDPTLAADAFSAPLTFIVTYSWGTPEREAIAHAYRDLQFVLILVALCLCIPLIACAFFLRDHRLGDVQSIEDVEQFEVNDSIMNLFKSFGGRTKAEKAAEKELEKQTQFA